MTPAELCAKGEILYSPWRTILPPTAADPLTYRLPGDASVTLTLRRGEQTRVEIHREPAPEEAPETPDSGRCPPPDPPGTRPHGAAPPRVFPAGGARKTPQFHTENRQNCTKTDPKPGF